MSTNLPQGCGFSASQQKVNTAGGENTPYSCYDFIREGVLYLMEMPMSLCPANSRLSPCQSLQLDWFLANTGLGCNPAQDRAAREAEFARLSALPDGALCSMGLSRSGLAAHVYRDLFHTGGL
jgi:hypothetical protein